MITNPGPGQAKPPVLTPEQKKFWGIVLAVVTGVSILWIAHNLLTISSPPLTCELIGGHWNILTGWRCG